MIEPVQFVFDSPWLNDNGETCLCTLSRGDYVALILTGEEHPFFQTLQKEDQTDFRPSGACMLCSLHMVL